MTDRAKAMTSEPSGIPGEFEEEDWVLVHLNGVRKGREAERAMIVAWLRKEAIMSTDTVRRRMNKALDQIEAGEHLR